MPRIVSTFLLILAASLPAVAEDIITASFQGNNPGNAPKATTAETHAPTIDESLDDTQYNNGTAKFSLTFPSDWIIDSNLRHSPTTPAWLSSRDKLSWFGVGREQNSGSLASYKEAFELRARRNLANYEKLSESSVTIDGKAGLLISYRVTAPKNDNLHVAYLMAIIPSGNTYTTAMAWCAEPRFHEMRPIFEKILTSYHSTGEPSATAAAPPMTSPLTVKKFESLRPTVNEPFGDYFIASPDEQKNIVRVFVEDNSRSDATFLYIAANTAYRIGEIKEAAFLFYAAQIRKRFDYKRYALGAANGNNIQTYWGFLNQTIGEPLNPAITRRPQEFAEVIDMIGKWQVVPADDALYDNRSYGKYALPKNQWQATGDSIKKDFLDNFGNKYKVFLSNPQNAEALNFVQDYNFNKIPHTPENDQRFQKDKDIVYKALNHP